jgi:hypothetical protein
MAEKQRAHFVQDEEGVHYYAETYVHRITTEQFVRVLRTIRELHAAGRPFNRTNLIEGSGVHHTQVSLVLNWLAYGVTACRKPGRKTADRVITDWPLWQRQVTAQWMALDDVEDVSDADVAEVFGDPRPAMANDPGGE